MEEIKDMDITDAAPVADEQHDDGDDGILGDKLPEPVPMALDAPDGLPIPEETLASFRDRCANLGLTQTQAEGLLAWHAREYQAHQALMGQLPGQILNAWSAEMQSDPEYGGVNFKRTQADGIRALKAFDPDGSVRAMLRETGMQFCPAVMRAMARIGRRMAEHDFIGGNGEGPAPIKPLSERLFNGGKA